MATQPTKSPAPGSSAPRFRIDPQMHERLMQSEGSLQVRPPDEEQDLPEPVYPLHPDRREKGQVRSVYHFKNGQRALRNWVLPFIRSRLFKNEFYPIISYLFTDYRCNIDCHYCWAYHDKTPGMTEDTARRAIDWLSSAGCRVLALMGGEPLLRPKFIHKVVYYAAQEKGFFVYLPTNGRLMKPEVIDRLGDAGVATVNLALDCICEKPGLPKALEPIRPYFDYLVKMQQRYGYVIVLNINICHNNMEDVRQLTELAYECGISTDYHINEPPLMEHRQFKHLDDNVTYLTPEDFPKVDGLLDELIDKNHRGYIMVNSRSHLADMKKFVRGEIQSWPCRAGQNTLIIRTDGTLGPCFAMYSARHDWGSAGDPHFEKEQLDAMKETCNRHCLSTCNYMLGHYYHDVRVLWWVVKMFLHGYQGVKK